MHWSWVVQYIWGERNEIINTHIYMHPKRKKPGGEHMLLIYTENPPIPVRITLSTVPSIETEELSHRQLSVTNVNS